MDVNTKYRALLLAQNRGLKSYRDGCELDIAKKKGFKIRCLKSYRDGCEHCYRRHPSTSPASLKSYRDGCELFVKYEEVVNHEKSKIIQRWM